MIRKLRYLPVIGSGTVGKRLWDWAELEFRSLAGRTFESSLRFGESYKG